MRLGRKRHEMRPRFAAGLFGPGPCGRTGNAHRDLVKPGTQGSLTRSRCHPGPGAGTWPGRRPRSRGDRGGRPAYAHDHGAVLMDQRRVAGLGDHRTPLRDRRPLQEVRVAQVTEAASLEQGQQRGSYEIRANDVQACSFPGRPDPLQDHVLEPRLVPTGSSLFAPGNALRRDASILPENSWQSKHIDLVPTCVPFARDPGWQIWFLVTRSTFSHRPARLRPRNYRSPIALNLELSIPSFSGAIGSRCRSSAARTFHEPLRRDWRSRRQRRSRRHRRPSTSMPRLDPPSYILLPVLNRICSRGCIVRASGAAGTADTRE